MGNNLKASMLTLLVSLINAVFVTVLNLIYNFYFIKIFGSQANGLVSTLTQFVSFFMIAEGGFTTAAVVSMYEPIINKDIKKINDILYTTRKLFTKIALIVTISVLIMGFVYLRVINSPFPFFKTYLLLVIGVLSSTGSLCLLSHYAVLFQGDNKEYIFTFVSLCSKIFIWIISIRMMIRGFDILLIYSFNIVNIIIELLIFAIYKRTKYPFVLYKGKNDKKLISGTKDVLFQKIANTIFTSTDLVLISAFVNLAFSSVYNLYNQIFRTVINVLLSVAQAPFNSIGHLANGNDKDKLIDVFCIYRFLVTVLTTVLVSVTGICIIPFLEIYTKNINDFEYIYPLLVILFFMQMFLQAINRPYGTLLNATGNFKKQNVQCFLAALSNIVISISLAKKYGIYGIIIGSILGTLIITVMNIYQVYRLNLIKSFKKDIINIVINFLLGIVSCIVCILLKKHIFDNYLELVILACIATVLVAIIVVLINYLVDKDSFEQAVLWGRDIFSKRKKRIMAGDQ